MMRNEEHSCCSSDESKSSEMALERLSGVADISCNLRPAAVAVAYEVYDLVDLVDEE